MNYSLNKYTWINKLTLKGLVSCTVYFRRYEMPHNIERLNSFPTTTRNLL